MVRNFILLIKVVQRFINILGGDWTPGLDISTTGGARDLAASDKYFFLINGSGNAIEIFDKNNGDAKGSLDISGIVGEGWGLTYIPGTNALVATDGDENAYWLNLSSDEKSISSHNVMVIPNGPAIVGAGFNYGATNLVFNNNTDTGEYTSPLQLFTAYGTPYSWLIDHGLSDDTTDPDLDGFLTWQEYICDTIPTDSNSFLSVSIAGTELSFDSSSNCLYGIDYEPSLVSNAWNTLTNNLPGSGSAITLTATNAAPCFFRLNAQRR